MKKIIFFFLTLLTCMAGFADGIPLTEEGIEEGELREQHKAPALLPQVFIDGEELSVLSPYLIDPAQIIIRDSADNIIYNVYVALPATTYLTILPAEVNAAKYKIELIYSGHHLVGFF